MEKVEQMRATRLFLLYCIITDWFKEKTTGNPMTFPISFMVKKKLWCPVWSQIFPETGCHLGGLVPGGLVP